MRDPRVCLRCDWLGETDAPNCPSCSAALFRPADSSPARRQSSTVPPGTPAKRERLDPITGSPARAPARRRIAGIASFLAALAVAAGVFSFVRAHTPAPAPLASGLRGKLVYAVADGPGWSRLWTWDLDLNTASEGPRVREAVQLVNAYGAGPDWIGVTSRLAGGRLSGGVLRYLDPTDQATPLLTADLVAWGARGEGVAGVRRAAGAGCRRLQVSYAGLVAPTGTEVRVDRRVCGEVLSLGRDELRTYLTLRRGGDTRLVFAGLNRFHLLLEGYVLASASPSADLLVVPMGTSPPDLTTLGDAGPHEPVGPAHGAGLFFRGLTDRHPIPFGTTAHEFRLDKVLGWSPDASVALVTGRLDGPLGIYELDAGPAPGRRTPRFVALVKGSTFGTYADDATGFVVSDSGVFRLEGGRSAPLALPPGAPQPDGPIVWIR